MGGWAEHTTLSRKAFLPYSFFFPPSSFIPVGKFLLQMPRGMAPKESFTCPIYLASITGKKTTLDLSASSLPSSCGILAFATVTIYFHIWWDKPLPPSLRL